MTDAAIIRATFETYKHVPTRKALQIILEVPAEGQEAVFKALGFPDPQNSVWVAVARLVDGAVSPDEVEKQQPQIESPADKPPAKLSQIAGIICSQGAFAVFMRDVKGYSCDAVEALRLYCGVDSRREFDDPINSSSRANFIALKRDYDAWLNCDDGIVRKELA